MRIKELERDLTLKEKELMLEIGRLKEEIKQHETELKQKTLLWEKERKTIAEHGMMSRRMVANMQREQQIMSGVFHKLGFEYFKEKHYGANAADS